MLCCWNIHVTWYCWYISIHLESPCYVQVLTGIEKITFSLVYLIVFYTKFQWLWIHPSCVDICHYLYYFFRWSSNIYYQLDSIHWECVWLLPTEPTINLGRLENNLFYRVGQNRGKVTLKHGSTIQTRNL